MTTFEFLFYATLIALVQGQTPTNGSRSLDHWARLRQHLASNGAIRNVQGQTPTNGSRAREHWARLRQHRIRAIGNVQLTPVANWRSWASIRQETRSSAVQSGGEQGPVVQAPANRTQSSRYANAPGRSPSASGRMLNGNSDRGVRDVQPAVSGADGEAESWRDLLAENNVTDLSGFLSLLVDTDGQLVRDSDLFYERPADGKILIAASGETMAISDECSPRNKSVRLDLNVSDPGVAYWPECTKIERCGGCTPRPYLQCVPRYTEIVILSVLKARYPYPGAQHMVMDGFAPVRVERHLSCRAECTLTAEDCGDHQEFVQTRCSCLCKTRIQCANTQVWDEDRCRCACRRQAQCCRRTDMDGRECPLFWDPDFCECTLKEFVGGSPNASQAEMEAWVATRRARQPPTVPPPNTPTATPPRLPPPSTSTTTPTTTTTPPTTTRAPCAHLQCPRQMIRAMTSTGRCLCQRRNRRY